MTWGGRLRRYAWDGVLWRATDGSGWRIVETSSSPGASCQMQRWRHVSVWILSRVDTHVYGELDVEWGKPKLDWAGDRAVVWAEQRVTC